MICVQGAGLHDIDSWNGIIRGLQQSWCWCSAEYVKWLDLLLFVATTASLLVSPELLAHSKTTADVMHTCLAAACQVGFLLTCVRYWWLLALT